MKVTNVDELMLRLEKVRATQKEFSKFSQEQVDEIFRQATVATNNERIRLAKMAVEESGMGIVEDKVIKNHFLSQNIYIINIKMKKTCGVIEKDESFGITKIAEPIGVVANNRSYYKPNINSYIQSFNIIKD